MPQDRRLAGLNFNVEEWDAKGLTYETRAICRTLSLGHKHVIPRLEAERHSRHLFSGMLSPAQEMDP